MQKAFLWSMGVQIRESSRTDTENIITKVLFQAGRRSELFRKLELGLNSTFVIFHVCANRQVITLCRPIMYEIYSMPISL